MEGKGGPEEVRLEEKEEDSMEGEKEETDGMEAKVISLHGKEEEGLQRKCLTGWINYQLSRHPRPPQGRVTDILHDLRSGLLLISLLEVWNKRILYSLSQKQSPQVLVPGLQAVKESGVHLRIHRLANLATVLATLQKERVHHLEKIVPEEVRISIRITVCKGRFIGEYFRARLHIKQRNHIILTKGGSRPPRINPGFALGDGELKTVFSWLFIVDSCPSLQYFAFNCFKVLLPCICHQVKHYQFRQVCLGTGLNPAPSPDTLLLAWARSAPGLEQVLRVFTSACLTSFFR